MRKLSKKGQLSGMSVGILSLVFAAIVLVFGLIMLQELRDTDVLDGALSATVVNETIGVVETSAGQYLDRVTSNCANNFVVYNMANATGGETIPSNNYTVNSVTGEINVVSSSLFNYTSWNASYTYNYGDEACRSANLSIVGLGTFADFWEIIVLAIVITVVIGLLLVVFGGRRER